MVGIYVLPLTGDVTQGRDSCGEPVRFHPGQTQTEPRLRFRLPQDSLTIGAKQRSA